MAMSVLPRFFVMQATSGGPYLCPVENPGVGRPKGHMRIEESQIWSPRVKFAVEQSETGDDTLVNIRSCYNNKYWVVYQFERIFWIAASADKPLEDQTNLECTLFRASRTSTSSGVQLRSIALGMNVQNLATTHGGGLTLSHGTQNFTIVDWETLVILPSQVSFQSEELDGNYLCSRTIDNLPYHRFESGLDAGDPLVAHELFPTNNGNYRIRNMHFGRFWRRGNNWIWADATETNQTNDTIFSLVKISDKVVALRNLGNNRFCGGDTREGKTDCLRAEYPTISRQVRLIVEERVLQREISDVRYRLSDSRIYEEEIQEVSHAFATNDSLNSETTIALRYAESDSRTSHWTNSVSVTVGVKVTFKTSIIPFIVKGGIELSTEIGYEHEWGVEETTERTREATYTVVVPPSSSKKVTLMCTKAACDVPFSYTQRDLLTSGEWVTIIKDDGIYTGINSYNFYFQSSKVVEDNQGRISIN